VVDDAIGSAWMPCQARLWSVAFLPFIARREERTCVDLTRRRQDAHPLVGSGAPSYGPGL